MLLLIVRLAQEEAGHKARIESPPQVAKLLMAGVAITVVRRLEQRFECGGIVTNRAWTIDVFPPQLESI